MDTFWQKAEPDWALQDTPVESLVLLVGERKAILPGWLGQENTFKYVQTSLKKHIQSIIWESPTKIQPTKYLYWDNWNCMISLNPKQYAQPL